jgi:hypothetical protein
VRKQSVPKASLFSASDASTYHKRLVKDVLGTRCPSLKINGKGQETPCADTRTLAGIVWALPSKAARVFRRTSAHTVCRTGGDLSLVAVIEACHNSLQAEGGKAAQTFLVKDSSCGEIERSPKRFKGELPMELQICQCRAKKCLL